MHKSILILAVAMLAAGCAPRFGGPIQQVGPNAYQITHSMGKFSPVKGVRQGVIDRASEKCAKQGKNYSKIREDMSLDGRLGYNLTFECK